MNYFEKKEIENKIKKDVDSIKGFDIVDHFIEANFRQFLNHGEHDDNSIDLAYRFNMLKSIEQDKEFYSKLSYVLSKYVK